MALSNNVESYKFWDVVTLWARELLEHEDIAASALARGIIRDGLKFQSIDTRWGDKKEIEFKGDPFVGFAAKPGNAVMVLRADVLEHLLAIVRAAKKPSRKILKNEFVLKADFKEWIEDSGQTLPSF